MLSGMEETHCTSSDLNVCTASEYLSGKLSTIALPDDSIGSSYGLLRAVQSGCFADYQATAHIKSMA
jgi:hypothetical protein